MSESKLTFDEVVEKLNWPRSVAVKFRKYGEFPNSYTDAFTGNGERYFRPNEVAEYAFREQSRIPLGGGYFATVDPQSFFQLCEVDWLHDRGYAVVRLNLQSKPRRERKRIYLASRVWELAYGEQLPIGRIGFKNGDRLDNRLENLVRLPEGHKIGRSPYVGVFFDGSKWRARVFINGKTIYVPGRFDTAEQAFEARQRFLEAAQ